MIKETWKYAKATLHSHFAIASFGSPNTVYLARSCSRSTHICQKLLIFKGILANIRYTETLDEIIFYNLLEILIAQSNDADKQLIDVKNFIDRPVDILLISPKVSNYLTPIVNQAFEKELGENNYEKRKGFFDKLKNFGDDLKKNFS